ncbi:MAG: cryptochrome/photolyase family protein [Roseivirga sp.]
MKTLRLILGDQLNSQHSWFQQCCPNVVYVMMELRQETDYVKHHIQKLIGGFAAMRSFAAQLQTAGHRVVYLKLDDPRNQQHLDLNLTWLLKEQQAERLEYLLPDEYRLDVQLQAFCEQLPLPTQAVDTGHFYTTRHELQQFFAGKQQLVMETFYRHMRQQHQVLLENGKPLGGKWNYDQQNRKRWRGEVPMPPITGFQNDCTALLHTIDQTGVTYFGKVDASNFQWPINREQALAALEDFLQNSLVHFGTYQDAMTTHSWHLFHARISFALNIKLIAPQEVVNKAINHWQQHHHVISIAQVEGFVRQIVGWREFMRGVYWAYMPDYATYNFFQHTRPLPAYYWTGHTKMRCMQYAITQSLTHAYAHHIQRLMVTGNFALLAGIHPDAVDAWYLGIYIDAIQWVEITNTRGMSQFADGGIVATKPYVSSANYIDKMSDYCGSCYYDPKKRYGARACPFNSLYWHFFATHRKQLQKNGRIGLVYKLLDKMALEERNAIIDQAQHYLENVDAL